MEIPYLLCPVKSPVRTFKEKVMALTKDEKKKLDETHDIVIQLKTVLLGTNSDNGLVGEFRRVAKSHFSLKRNFWVLVGILAGLGLLGTGLFSLLGGG